MAKISNVHASAGASPSEQIIRRAAATASFKDRLGRLVELRQIRGLLRMRFLKALGDQHENSAYAAYAAIAASVAAVDGLAIPFPNKQAEIEALVERFDDGMLDDVAREYRAAFTADDGDVEEAKN